MNLLSLIYNILKSIFSNIKKVKEEIPDIPEIIEGDDNMTHHDYIPPKITKRDQELAKEFKDENHIIEDSWNYRKGAPYTAYFGIANGWGPNMEPGYIRIHPGVDRANGGEVQHGDKIIKDVVISPLNFDMTHFIDYGDKSYGTLIFLGSKKYQFDMRIAHMHPKNDIIPWALKQFKAGNQYKQGWLIGSAGTYGYSTGAHTHTELVSHDESCEVFEILLRERFGDDVGKEYTPERIVTEYQKRPKYKGWSEGQILEDWLNKKKEKRVIFINDYKYLFYWKDKIFTRYATDKVLKGL